MQDAAVQRVRATHGQGVANAVVSLAAMGAKINLDALCALPTATATRAVELVAAVRRGDAWRAERHSVTDDEVGRGFGTQRYACDDRSCADTLRGVRGRSCY
jgi:hypothetical protein